MNVLWGELSGNELPTNEQLKSTVNEATVYMPMNSIKLWYDSFDATAAAFTNCKPCDKSLKIEEIGRVGIGYFGGTNVPEPRHVKAR